MESDMSGQRGSTTQEIAARFVALADHNDWFGIQDELFAEEVVSIEPENSPWLKTVSGKAAVRAKGEAWVRKVEAVHSALMSAPVVAGDYFAVARELDLTVVNLGRIAIKELMVYHTRNGKIISEQFFY